MPDPLLVKRIDFLGGMSQAGGWRPESTLPEIAFMGRSNVGKSSLLNALVRRRALARVSRTPGRTRQINFFRVNDAFVFVDLPGYGYARLAKERRQEWRPLIEAYLRDSPHLRGIVLLLDSRREPSGDDHAIMRFLAELELPTIIAITKMDKFGPRTGDARVSAIVDDLQLDPQQVIPVSSRTGQGRTELAAAISDLLEQNPWRHEQRRPT